MEIGKTFRVINEKVRNRLVTASDAGRGIKDHTRAVPGDFRKNDAPATIKECQRGQSLHITSSSLQNYNSIAENKDSTHSACKHLPDSFCVSFKRMVMAPVFLMASIIHYLENISYKTKATICMWEADSEPSCPFGSSLGRTTYCFRVSFSQNVYLAKNFFNKK